MKYVIKNFSSRYVMLTTMGYLYTKLKKVIFEKRISEVLTICFFQKLENKKPVSEVKRISL